jgi:hypothetical protein
VREIDAYIGVMTYMGLTVQQALIQSQLWLGSRWRNDLFTGVFQFETIHATKLFKGIDDSKNRYLLKYEIDLGWWGQKVFFYWKSACSSSLMWGMHWI